MYKEYMSPGVHLLKRYGKYMKNLLKEGRNCWRIDRANRVGFMIDAREYFAAFVESVEQARKSVYIAGWDINSQIELLRGEDSKEGPTRLSDFLNHVVSQRPGLHVYILAWDFAILYAFEREPFPIWKFRWKSHPRIHFCQDDHIPVGASHHQKIVVVDDRVAFVGGIDLTIQRWDDQDHAAHDPRRVDPRGKLYKPFHDVQMVVEGKVAESLGDLFRSRWRDMSRRGPRSPKLTDQPPAWPQRVPAALENIDVGISRTMPEYEKNPEIREVEHLWVDAIRAAERYVYIENPFFTSHAIGSVIEERLSDEACPEIVLISREKSRGWLEEHTMDALRANILNRLWKADRYSRLKVYYPRVPHLGQSDIDVHAKVLITDNEFLRIGSSNLSNRSMGLDTECDLSIEARDDRDTLVIRGFLGELLGEHLGHAQEQVTDTITSSGSLISAIESLKGEGRTLEDLQIQENPETVLSDQQLVDPEKPIDPDELFDHYVPKEDQQTGHSRLKWFVLILVVLMGLGILWRWSPVAEMVDVKSLAAWAEPIRLSPLAPVIVIAYFLLGGLVLFPVTVLIAATALVFDPLSGCINSLLGAVSSAIVIYFIGYLLGRRVIRPIAGRNINRISKVIATRGIISIVFLRVIPVAPFSIINLVAGASHIRFSDYLIGTLLGMTPGIVIITLFTDSLRTFLLDPGIWNILLLAVITAVSVIVLVLLKRHVFRNVKNKDLKHDGSRAREP
ncbi:MAG TPA: hypothetical protein ENN34_13780 [Deltaproteobacteria bacterium]|nr:hypothetical protein [Deltaproteobacteria bacterium]